MELQKYFIDFNKAIKMDYDENSGLADKRDKLLKKLSSDDSVPSFNRLDQGSYAMHTGVEPLDKEYDIDVGLRFSKNKEDYENPMELKRIVKNVLENHTDKKPVIKSPCVTITYKDKGEDAYHVDLAIYVYENKDDTSSQMYLARGKDSKPEEICWEKSDPKGLVDYINSAISDSDDREQFRRIIRYLKRWKNKVFSSSGNAEPPSIGITMIVADKFAVKKKTDIVSGIDSYNDLEALYNIVSEIQKLFVYKGINQAGREIYTISYTFPSDLKFEPGVNIFQKMSDNYMTSFKEKIDTLLSDLKAVRNEADVVEQCKKLNKIFGDDFKIPEVKEESKTQKRCIPSSSAAGVW